MTLDPTLQEITRRLLSFRRRLWLRRMVRDGLFLLAALAATELALALLARVTPLEWHRLGAAALASAAAIALLLDAVRVRPTLAETALGLDREQQLRERVSSALALAVRHPQLAEVETGEHSPADDDTGEAATYASLVRRQRRDALATLLLADPAAFRPRYARGPLVATLACALLLVPALLIPNPQSDVLANRQQKREAAERQATRLEATARRLSEGRTSTDPRAQLAEELKKIVQDLRQRPDSLDSHLARLGSLEDAVRSRLDPSTEQKAAGVSSLARSISQAQTGRDSNPQGDPSQAKKDLGQLAQRLGSMSTQDRAKLAAQLEQLRPAARLVGGETQQTADEAAQSLASGDVAGAANALQRLGEALNREQGQVQVQRDLARAASDLQDARRQLADAGRQGQAQQGRTQQGQGQPGRIGQGQQGQGQGQSPGAGQGQGQGQSAGTGQGQGQGQGQSPGTGQGQGQGAGQSPGTGQGQGQGQSGQGQQSGGSLGGGGSNARFLGSGVSTGSIRGPRGPNRQFGTGGLDKVYADFQRLGKPGDPSYVSGARGNGQTQQGSGSGSGTNNNTLVPYTDVLQDFADFAITSLDRSYVPLGVKDYVRDYFSSLNPR